VTIPDGAETRSHVLDIIVAGYERHDEAISAEAAVDAPL